MSSDLILALYDENKNRFMETESELIGKGGFGRVFRVFNKLDDRFYAIKKILVTERNMRSALHEIRILASIVHPNVIRYFHSWIEAREFSDRERMKIHFYTEDTSRCSSMEEDEREEEDTDAIFLHKDCCYFFNIQMEYCEGSLRQYMWNRVAVNYDQCFQIMRQVIHGLHFIHNNGIIHRDMKPDNILIYQRNPLRIKISDFGLAKVFQKNMMATESSNYTGTYLYASPEQFQGNAYTFSTDIYSLGIVLLEIQHLFKTEMERIVTLQKANQRIFPAETAYASLIDQMLSIEPLHRPSIIQLHNIFDPTLNHHMIWCRDIIWEILLSM